MGDQECNRISPCQTRKKNSRLWLNKSSPTLPRHHLYFTLNYVLKLQYSQSFDQAKFNAEIKMKIAGIKFLHPMLKNKQSILVPQIYIVPNLRLSLPFQRNQASCQLDLQFISPGIHRKTAAVVMSHGKPAS